MPRRPAARVAAVAAAAVVAATASACTADSQGARQTPPPADSATSPTADATATPEPTATGPLVAAVHPTRGRLDLTTGQVRRLSSAELGSRLRLGRPARRFVVGTLEDVRRSPVAVALVPATLVDPRVGVATIDGLDPLRGPLGGRVTTVTVTGDVMLGRRVGDRLDAAGDPAAALRPMARRLARADLTIGNLESTLSKAGAPRQGGDSFGASPSVLRGLRLAGFDVLSLANNHTGDYGPRALVQTVQRVRDGGFRAVGAGADLGSAARPVVVRRNGVTFGIVAFDAIGETPAASAAAPGALRLRMQPRTGPLNRSDLDRVTGIVRDLAGRVDVVLVLPHWGAQYTHRTVRDQRLVARALVRAGADVVVGGHPHWVQGVEARSGGFVAYSLGNFVFDMDFMQQTQEGVLLELTFWGAELKNARLAPYVIGPDFAPRLTTARRADAILADVWRASGPPLRGTHDR